MVQTADIKIKKTSVSRAGSIDFTKVTFGSVFSDHMYIADYLNGEWTDARIVPYGNLPMSPALAALHYGQAIFEGMKAYRAVDNEVYLSRPHDNFRRFNMSADRMCMPLLPEEVFIGGLFNLINLDRNWVPPSMVGYSLYIRPVMFSSDNIIGVRPSATYRFVILTCPVGSYYNKPLRVKIETDYSRAAHGGAGFVKAAGNYGAAMKPTKDAHDAGYDQIIWTDSAQHKYIEEAGTMNLMFVLRNKLITAPLDTKTILPGITRESILTIAGDNKIPAEERMITVDEIIDGAKKGELQEAFGTGTAATIARIKTIGYNGKDYELPPVESGKISKKIYQVLSDIRRRKMKDPYGWMVKV
ncbi:MAG: branched-chain amino acid aminotransferase [Bacteroidetes bacterium]|nr:branched-chain amino acid aminotransferase [Bacteroidota bacterium]